MHLRHALGVISFTLLLLGATSATADPQPTPKPDDVRYKAKTIVDFSDVRLTGEVTKPSATLITGRRRARFKVLIRVRGDFRPELFRTIEQID